MKWGQDQLELKGGEFVQVNREAGRILHDYILQEAGHVEGMKVVDAYCGGGMLGRELGRAGARVTGIDLDPAGEVEGESGAPGFRLVVGKVEETLETELPADLVILNPPRSGLAGPVPALLRSQPPPTIVYVSCDPATLARDLKRMGPGFSVEGVRCFDLFPQTGHVETAVTLRRQKGENP